MSFREVKSRLHKGHGAENFSRLRRIAMNKHKGDPDKGSLKNKRCRRSIDPAYTCWKGSGRNNTCFRPASSIPN